jgi:acyl-CoA synthetase (AMP-forming)/AMP-acid ligase II
MVKMKTASAIPGGWVDVASALDRSLAQRPDAEALVGRFGRYSYRQLDAAINAAASALASLGVGQGDRVAASAPNHPDIVIAFFASQRLGAIWVGINRPLAGPEKQFQLQDSGAKVFLADAASREQIAQVRAELPELEHIVDMEPGPSNAWLELVHVHDGAPRPDVAIDPHAPAAIAYTSGTTGFPKGAVHSQHNMMVVAATTHAGVRGAHQDPLLRRGVTLALTILNLMILDAVTPLCGGGATICMDRADAIGVAEWVAQERIETFTSAPATVFDLLTKPEIDPQGLASLKFAMAGGANVPDELRRLYRERFGQPLLGGYGLTEAPTAVAGTSATRPLVPGSCGRAFDHLKVRILDESGGELPHGETGEICVRAADAGPWADVYTTMLGYWRRPEESAAALQGGWLHTGDIGTINADGDIFIKDRLKELIIRGGANIYPAEVERVLTGHPSVRDAAVIGKPDARLGEIVAAFVEKADDAAADAALEAELRELCLAKLARYKAPEAWSFGALPRNAMGKIAKAKLRDSVKAGA